MIARIPQAAYKGLRAALVIANAGKNYNTAFQSIRFHEDGFLEATDGFRLFRQFNVEVAEPGTITIEKLPANARDEVVIADGAVRAQGQIIAGYTDTDVTYPDTLQVIPETTEVLPYSNPATYNALLAAPVLKVIEKELKSVFPRPTRKPNTQNCLYTWETENGGMYYLVAGRDDAEANYWQSLEGK